MEEREVSGERGEVIESTEQERIQNEEEVFILTFMPLGTKAHYCIHKELMTGTSVTRHSRI